MPNIEHFSKIDGSTGFAGSQVGFGGVTPDSDMTWLKEQGFATVINLRLAGEEGVDVECSRDAAEAAGLKYIHLPFSGRELDRQLVIDFLTMAGDCANQPVYIHCRSATRVAALWVIGRVLKDGWEFEATRDEADAIAHKPADALAYARAYLAAHGV
jgi:uncharacterized protein (TIGR01244 family)